MKLLIIFLLFFIYCPIYASDDTPIPLSKIEGSKSFDMEIDRLNNKGIMKYKWKL